MDSKIDLSAGIILNKKVDDKVEIGDILAYIHANNIDKAKEVEKKIKEIFIIGGDKNKESKKTDIWHNN